MASSITKTFNIAYGNIQSEEITDALDSETMSDFGFGFSDSGGEFFCTKETIGAKRIILSRELSDGESVSIVWKNGKTVTIECSGGNIRAVSNKCGTCDRIGNEISIVSGNKLKEKRDDGPYRFKNNEINRYDFEEIKMFGEIKNDIE